MPYASNADLPESVRTALPTAAQSTWRKVFNSAMSHYDDDAKASATAWSGLKNAGWKKNEEGKWVKTEKFDVAKLDEDRHLVFGWANVAIRKDGEQITDSQNDIIDPDDLEDAAYLFNLEYRGTGEMHKGEAIGRLIESFAVTPEKLKKLGLSQDSLPQGWWVGFYIENDEVWKRVKDGTYAMFSIQGRAVREEV